MANISREERARREAAAKDNQNTEDQVGSADFRVENPREPVEPVSHDAQPVSPATGAFPVGTPGHAEPTGVSDAEAAANEARERIETIAKPKMVKVIVLRGYQPVEGDFLRPIENPQPSDAVEMRIEDARHLEESGIVQSADTYAYQPPAQKRR